MENLLDSALSPAGVFRAASDSAVDRLEAAGCSTKLSAPILEDAALLSAGSIFVGH